MKRLDLTAHGLIALVWVSCALGISLKVALLGNEAATAAHSRGVDFKTRSELAFKQDRLRTIFEQASCAPAISQIVRTIDLPLQPPVITASIGHRP
jgi:hypothetical protein